jgi:ornithine cyclodeaminase/alanine dehydrogenase-like protein (mu-crystallin family)
LSDPGPQGGSTTEEDLKSLSQDHVKAALDPRRLIAAIEEAFRDRYPTTLMPVRTQMKLANGIFLIMPCYDREGQGLGMKLIMVRDHPINGEEKLPATYLILDPATGYAKMIMPAAYLTEIRTAATSAVATKFLAREDVRVLGIFGTGRQARSHLQVLRHVRNFQHFLVSGSDAGRSREFAQEMSREFGAPVESVYSRACASESDVLCTCTNSPSPLFDGNLLRAGTHLNLVGSFQPHTREVDDVTVQRSRIVVDTFEGALAEAGDLLIPINKGLITRNQIFADLHQLVSRKRTVRTRPDEITLFKSVGCALEDLAAAELVAATATA